MLGVSTRISFHSPMADELSMRLSGSREAAIIRRFPSQRRATRRLNYAILIIA